MRISRVGFGTWALGGGGWRSSWGSQDDEESIAAIHRALELGVNWIDTAPVYGSGHSETIVGRALAGLTERPLVFTKASLLVGPDRREYACLKRDSIRREVEASLQRLGVDAIDLYQVHDAAPEDDLEEGWSTFKELLDEGLVRHIGVSNFTIEQMRRISSIAPIDTIQPPYSLIDRAAEADLLPFAEREGIGVIVYSPMGSGMLTGRMTRERIEAMPEDDWRTRHPAYREPRLGRNLATAERVRAVASDLGVPPGAVAVAWTLRNPAVDGAIVGFRRPDQVDDLISAASLELADADVARL
jgi:aryl-alcohol dehydrogenase-like predicted oxidoreductase